MLKEHLGYVSDKVRLELFRAAVADSVKPGDLIADIGCGSGILGLMCLRAGAAHVFAIDETPMIDLARGTLERAGLGERASFIRERSQRATLPQRVDLVVCDHVGYFGFDYLIIPLLRDARQRFLKPGGRIIPNRIKLSLAAVEAPQARAQADGWHAPCVPPEFHWIHKYAINAKHDVKLNREELLSTPTVLGELDFTKHCSDFVSWTARLRMARDGVLHGLSGWFECELADGIWMTNSPLAEGAIDRPQVFLPTDQPVEVTAGELVNVTIMARVAEPMIAWTLEFPASGRRFSHSTWQGMILAPQDIVHANPSRVPVLSQLGQARISTLSYCDGKRTISEVIEAVQRDHPNLFPSAGEVSAFVAHVLSRDTE